ncbi:MAG: M20/M25/M40 family metallo-hydrolase, partial [Planctomycetota bacterium]
MSPSLLPTLPSSRSFVSIAVAFAAFAAIAPAQGLAKDRATGAGMVDVAACQQWLGMLASEEFGGRGTGQPGFEKAANYVAAHFKALGLEARGADGDYFQRMPWPVTSVVPEKTFVRIRTKEGQALAIPAERMQGIANASLSAKGDVALLAVDVPAPAPRPEGTRQDGQSRFNLPQIPGLDAVDVKDKVVFVYLRQTGEQPNPLGNFAVSRALQGKEAAAVVFVQKSEVRGGIEATGGRRAGGRLQPPQPTIGGKDVEQLLAAAGTTIDALAEAPLLTVPALQGEIGIAIAERESTVMNVFAVLPGSDPKKKDEYVVIGSHLDHLGRRGDRYFPGADDDGSGTTGVLAVSQMLAKNPVKPARSVLFVCFCGEENGLRGSRHFADNCPIPLSSIVAELQMDMIGRDEEENAEGDKGEKAEDNRNTVHLIGTKKLAPALHDLCIAKNATAGLDIEWDQEGMYSRSDHANFARHGVPIAFFFTGLHRDYHQPSDTPDKIHYEKLLRIATWVYDIAFELAVQEGRPEIEPELWQKLRGNRGPEQPAAPLRGGNAGGGKDTG